MMKHEFLRELLKSLSSLPQIERDKAYAFYAEIIDDSMEDGMSEEDAVAKLGGMEDIVDHIVAEIPISVLLKSRVEHKKRGRFTIFLLILGFPLWFPVLITVLCVPLVLFIVLWAVDLVLWAVCAAIAAAALGSVIGLFSIPGVGEKLMSLGGALVCGGLTVPLVLAAFEGTRQFAYLTNRLWIKIKNSLLKKRGNVQ